MTAVAIALVIHWMPGEVDPCAMREIVGQHEIAVQQGPVGHVLVSDQSCPSGLRWKPYPRP
jgi:hypothetical protein